MGVRCDRHRADHPRTRGVYCFHQKATTEQAGSSPHARGLPGPSFQILDFVGIIPARAGFTPAPPCGGGGASDHPRTRGVYLEPSQIVHLGVGSSPHARGLHVRRVVDGCLPGIIPARAGFTVLAFVATIFGPDHPRTRGVYVTVSGGTRGRQGSSPHARGLPATIMSGRPIAGIIPARAGFTGALTPRERGCSDHPRTRGVYDGRPRV